jgi:hypothetical protein
MEDLIEILFALLVGDIPWQLVVLGGVLVAGYYAAGFVMTAEPELRRGLLVGGFAVLGAGVGALSVWMFPGHYFHALWLRWLNLLVSPIAGGLFMVGLDHLLRPRLAPGAAPAVPATPLPEAVAAGKGKARRKPKAGAKPPRVPLPPPTDGQLFARGFLFCLAFALVRFVWGG